MLAEQGGEIMPEEFRAKPLPIVENPAAKPREVDVPGSQQLKEEPAPVPRPDTPEQLAWKEHLAGQINVELNIFNSVARSVRRLVNSLISEQPMDSADIGESQFGGGKRTPLEENEPLIALEVYKQVRKNMRDDTKRKEESELEALRALMERALPGYRERGRR